MKRIWLLPIGLALVVLAGVIGTRGSSRATAPPRVARTQIGNPTVNYDLDALPRARLTQRQVDPETQGQALHIAAQRQVVRTYAEAAVKGDGATRDAMLASLAKNRAESSALVREELARAETSAAREALSEALRRLE